MAPHFLRWFDLRRDQQDPDQIDEALRAGAAFAGTNLWVLFFAILIASVGLNTNSTAAIIGAMLISPLMGPIIGIGYGAAVFDLQLIRKAAKRLAVFVGLSLATSMLYFLASPLADPGSELLARTSPTVWDVLIAAFGGAAGMVALTRRNFSNIVPGVAIATALMPPLCTAGFGIAHARWDMAAGALYLFVINGVFIATSTLLVARGLRLPARGKVDDATRMRHRIVIAVGIVAVIVPSIFLTYRLVHQELFVHAAQKVASALRSDPKGGVLSHELEPASRTLHLTVFDRGEAARIEAKARALLLENHVGDGRVAVRYAGDPAATAVLLRQQLQDDLRQRLSQQLQATDARLRALQAQVDDMGAAKARDLIAQAPSGLLHEIRAQYPDVVSAALVQGDELSATGSVAAAQYLVLSTRRSLRPAERAAIERWIAVRTAQPTLRIIEQAAPPARRVAQR